MYPSRVALTVHPKLINLYEAPNSKKNPEPYDPASSAAFVVAQVAWALLVEDLGFRAWVLGLGRHQLMVTRRDIGNCKRTPRLSAIPLLMRGGLTEGTLQIDQCCSILFLSNLVRVQDQFNSRLGFGILELVEAVEGY